MNAGEDPRRAVGRWGEGLAVDYLTRRGMSVVDRNWRCDQGEIDIVARDGDALVVCEVKTRTSLRFGDPVEAVTWRKQLRLRRLAGAWLHSHDERAEVVRIDVIGILRRPGCRPQLRHLVGVG